MVAPGRLEAGCGSHDALRQRHRVRGEVRCEIASIGRAPFCVSEQYSGASVARGRPGAEDPYMNVTPDVDRFRKPSRLPA